MALAKKVKKKVKSSKKTAKAEKKVEAIKKTIEKSTLDLIPPPKSGPTPQNPVDIFKAYLEQAPFSTLVTDARGVCIWVNHSYCRLFGAKAKDTVGVYNFLLDPVIKQLRLMKKITEVLKKGMLLSETKLL